MARLFNAYVIADWSANAKPKTGADSIWIGVLKRDVRFQFTFESFNPATRAEAEARLVVLAEAEPDDLYPAGDGAFEFERTASRLHEMRSADWLAKVRE